MIEAGLRTLLLSRGLITAAVGTGVRVNHLRENDTLPAIVIDIPTSTHHNDIEGDGGLVQSTVTFMCMANTIQGARELSETLRREIAGYEGPAGLSTLQGIIVDETTSGFVPADDGGQNGIYSCDLNCTVWHSESVPV